MPLTEHAAKSVYVRGFIIHHQNSFEGRWIRGAGLLSMGGAGPLGRRQKEGKPASPSRLAFHQYLTPMFMDDLMADEQAQSRSDANGLGGEKGVKDLFQVLFRYSLSRVLDLDED